MQKVKMTNTQCNYKYSNKNSKYKNISEFKIDINIIIVVYK